jgi:hypothetical protein
MLSWASRKPLKPSPTLNDKLLKFSDLSLLCSKLLQLCKHRLIVNNIGNMMMMAKQVYKVAVMLTPLMLVIVLLAKLLAVVMEVVVVAVLAVEAVDLLPNVCVVNVMILVLHNQSTVMRMGWANPNSPCPNSWVLLMLKSISIGS